MLILISKRVVLGLLVLATSGQVLPAAAAAEVHVLQLRDDVEVASKIIRLKDILSPVGEPPPEWNRLGAAAVALLPSDGRRLRIERQRVSEAVRRSGLVSGPLRVVGPDYASVRYAPVATPDATGAAKVAVADHRPREGTAAPMAQVSAHRVATEEPVERLLPAERNRIQRMIEAAFRGSHADVVERFEVAMNDNHPGFDRLGGLREIRNLRLLEPPESGTVGLEVHGDGETGPLRATVMVELEALPVAVVAAGQLNSGDIVSEHDLATKPLPRNQFRDEYVTDPKVLIGKEVVRSLAGDRPIRYDDVREPIVIKRGDLIELRVVAGGITVSTNAKAAAPAAAGERIMVETESPRRRLMARAVRSGLAEIVTRPPTAEADINGR